MKLAPGCVLLALASCGPPPAVPGLGEPSPTPRDGEPARPGGLLEFARESVTCDPEAPRLVGVCKLEGEADRPVAFLVSDASAIPSVEQRLRTEFSRRQPGAKGLDFKADLRFVVVGEFRVLEPSAEGPTAGAMRESGAPVPIGAWVRPEERGGKGTLGCRVRSRTDHDLVFLLSAEHVLVPRRSGRDERIRIYGPIVPGSRGAEIGVVFDSQPVRRTETNVMEAAIAETTREKVARTWPGGQVEPRLRPVRGRRGMRAMKYGRTTKARGGTVWCADATLCVRFGGLVKFEKQVIIASDHGDSFCSGGDSGALVMDDRCNPMGLLFARNDVTLKTGKGVETLDNACLANSIGGVLARFEVEIDPPVERRDLRCDPPEHVRSP